MATLRIIHIGILQDTQLVRTGELNFFFFASLLLAFSPSTTILLSASRFELVFSANLG